MLVSDGGAGNVVYHLYGNSHLGQQVQGSSQFQTFITDGLGSVRVEMETSGATNYVRTFSPFGETLDEKGNRSSVYGYTGQQEDASTGLIYLRARYYSAELKAFTAYDLWEGVNSRPSSLNHYAYVEGNPANLIDPSGKYGCGPNGYLKCSDGSETPVPHPSAVRAIEDSLDGWAQVGSAVWHSTASYATDRDAFNNQWQNNYEAGRNLAIAGYRHSPINMVINPRSFGKTWQNSYNGLCAGIQNGWDTLRTDPVYGLTRGAWFAGEIWAGAYIGKAAWADDAIKGSKFKPGVYPPTQFSKHNFDRFIQRAYDLHDYWAKQPKPRNYLGMAEQFRTNYSEDLSYISKFYADETGQIQGAIFYHDPPRLTNEHGLYVHSLLSTQGGAGTELLKDAVRESIDRGYGGKFQLNPIPGTEEYYPKLGPEKIYTTDDFYYYYWDERASQNLLNK